MTAQYVLGAGGLNREIKRQYTVSDDEGLLINKNWLEVKVGKIVDAAEGKVRRSTKIKTGDLVYLAPSAQVVGKQRITEWTHHPELTEAGVVYGYPDKIFPDQQGPIPLLFKALTDIDVKELEYLYRGLVVNEVVRD